MIYEIKDLDQLNSILGNFDYRHLKNFDLNAAYAIKNSLITSYRNYYNSDSSEIFITYNNPQVDYNLVINDHSLLDVYNTYAPASSTHSYFYPFPRQKFIDTFLSQTTPTIANSIFDSLIQLGMLKQIGSGNGKAFVFNYREITQEEFDSLVFPSSNPAEIINIVKDNISVLSSSIQDFNYLVDEIKQRDDIIDSLRNEIQSLNNKILSLYQTTWR
jgi:hypothetical protein